jgi:hypothetical protein
MRRVVNPSKKPTFPKPVIFAKRMAELAARVAVQEGRPAKTLATAAMSFQATLKLHAI